jgi:hypothetical protein
MVATRRNNPGQPFRRPVEVGRARYGDDVKLAVAADGAAVIVWSRMNLIQAVFRRAAPCVASARACFGPVQRIPGDCPAGVITCRDTRVAFGAHDRAYLAWTADGSHGNVVRNVIRLAVSDGRTFGSPRTISASASAWQPSIAVLPNGSVVLAWLGEPGFVGAHIMAAVSDPDGRPISAPQTVSAVAATEGCYHPQLSTNRQGQATLVWECNPQGFTASRIAAAVRPPGGSFGPAIEIAPADSHASDPSLAVDSQGNTIIAYNDQGAILARVKRPGQGFDAPVLVGTGSPSQLLGAGDKVTLTWPTPRGTMLSDWTP